MKIWDRIWKKKIFAQDEAEGVGDEILTEKTLERDDVDMHDSIQRAKYVENCLEQIAEASTEMEHLEGEYHSVDAYLKDMEEVERLDGADKETLEEHAKKVSYLSKDSDQFEDRKRRLKDEDYKKMRRLEDNAQEGITKLREAEQYQEAIRQDLRRLEGEKQACLYRQSEASIGLSNYRGMAVILVCAIFICVLLLLFLQFGLKMDATIGYVLVMLAGGIALVVLYVRYVETGRELRSATAGLNKLILLQNKVKIRYVNNTNLLDYLYLKYEISSSDSLERLWNLYQEEKAERAHMQKVFSDLDYHIDGMVGLLKRHHVHDPLIWTRQAEAILDPREMVEVRHNLIIRRQKLRKQMDYNKELAANAQAEIKELAGLYPQYAAEIMNMVEMYEKKYRK